LISAPRQYTELVLFSRKQGLNGRVSQGTKKSKTTALKPVFTQLPRPYRLNFALKWVSQDPRVLESVRTSTVVYSRRGERNTDPAYPRYFIRAKFFKKFILSNVGLFLVYQNNILLKNDFYQNRSQFKKKLLSFVYPENEKKAIFLRKKKLTLKSILRNMSKNVSLTRNFSYKNLNQIYDNAKSLFNSDESVRSESVLFNYASSPIDILDTRHHRTKGLDNRYLFTLREAKLSRVRFKPGYQKL
jgi:hypothetical protein